MLNGEGKERRGCSGLYLARARRRDAPHARCSTGRTRLAGTELMASQARQTCLSLGERLAPEEIRRLGERGGVATVASSYRGFTGGTDARVQGHFPSSSGARGLQAASAGKVGSEGQDGGDRRGAGRGSGIRAHR